MALYEWRGRNSRGEAVNGQLEAMTEGGVADQLRSMGVAPVYIGEAKAQASEKKESLWSRLNRKPIVTDDLLIFSRQMYTLNKAGVPILRAFAGLEASATKPAMVDMLRDIRSGLDQGRELSSAMGRFSELSVPSTSP